MRKDCFMRYNTEKLLTIFKDVPLNINKAFSEQDNENLNDYISKTLFDGKYIYEYGATKLVFIPLTEDNFVIKIPYTGNWHHSGSYYSENSNVYYPGDDYYEDFEHARSEESDWDYCAVEAERYIKARQAGFGSCLAETRLLGFINEYPIYVQEKAIPLSDCKKSHTHTKEERTITSKICKDCFLDTDWLTDFRLYYGKATLINFINFINENKWDNDLVSRNIGYIKNRPVLIDYSGFYD